MSVHRSRLQRVELSDTQAEQTALCQKASRFINLFCWFTPDELGSYKSGRKRCPLYKAEHTVMDGTLNNTKLKVSGSNQGSNFYIVNAEKASLKCNLYLLLPKVSTKQNKKTCLLGFFLGTKTKGSPMFTLFTLKDNSIITEIKNYVHYIQLEDHSVKIHIKDRNTASRNRHPDAGNIGMLT